MRTPLLMIAFGAALAAGATTAAATGPVPTLAAPIADPVVVVGVDGNGQAQALTVGQELAVALPESPSTGYAWQLREADQNVLRQEGEPQFKPDAAFTPGGPGTTVWTFTAATAGTTKLTLATAPTQPWAQATPQPPQQFTLTVTVR
ncbi:protease inhibitor I42 family protein [Nocardia pseudobrasiliensis]|uniref:Inhibitor of cysteine peptidase n=1 Tax=Nocardia pseudobrasiliensis TaxID=45979 RepID=A0A370HMR6_9NOCA|nr:protease inhibitor I42 family protein [Nocardia pseudobrasiliensis]RDI59630.1 inhibitor of cysteine peptidase [Nocardia pseudobrasiliensis]